MAGVLQQAHVDGKMQPNQRGSQQQAIATVIAPTLTIQLLLSKPSGKNDSSVTLASRRCWQTAQRERETPGSMEGAIFETQR